MGVDAVLKARLHEPPMEPKEFELQRAFRERWPADDFYTGEDYRYPDLEFDEFEPVQTLQVVMMDRYYGSGYERGDWPALREKGDWLALQIGERGEVRYGGDTMDEWDALEPWPDARRKNDAHWDQFQNRPYDERWRT